MAASHYHNGRPDPNDDNEDERELKREKPRAMDLNGDDPGPTPVDTHIDGDESKAVPVIVITAIDPIRSSNSKRKRDEGEPDPEKLARTEVAKQTGVKPEKLVALDDAQVLMYLDYYERYRSKKGVRVPPQALAGVIERHGYYIARKSTADNYYNGTYAARRLGDTARAQPVGLFAPVEPPPTLDAIKWYSQAIHRGKRLDIDGIDKMFRVKHINTPPKGKLFPVVDTDLLVPFGTNDKASTFRAYFDLKELHKVKVHKLLIQWKDDATVRAHPLAAMTGLYCFSFLRAVKTLWDGLSYPEYVINYQHPSFGVYIAIVLRRCFDRAKVENEPLRKAITKLYKQEAYLQTYSLNQRIPVMGGTELAAVVDAVRTNFIEQRQRIHDYNKEKDNDPKCIRMNPVFDLDVRTLLLTPFRGILDHIRVERVKPEGGLHAHEKEKKDKEEKKQSEMRNTMLINVSASVNKARSVDDALIEDRVIEQSLIAGFVPADGDTRDSYDDYLLRVATVACNDIKAVYPPVDITITVPGRPPQWKPQTFETIIRAIRNEAEAFYQMADGVLRNEFKVNRKGYVVLVGEKKPHTAADHIKALVAGKPLSDICDDMESKNTRMSTTRLLVWTLVSFYIQTRVTTQGQGSLVASINRNNGVIAPIDRDLKAMASFLSYEYRLADAFLVYSKRCMVDATTYPEFSTWQTFFVNKDGKLPKYLFAAMFNLDTFAGLSIIPVYIPKIGFAIGWYAAISYASIKNTRFGYGASATDLLRWKRFASRIKFGGEDIRNWTGNGVTVGSLLELSSRVTNRNGTIVTFISGGGFVDVHDAEVGYMAAYDYLKQVMSPDGVEMKLMLDFTVGSPLAMCVYTLLTELAEFDRLGPTTIPDRMTSDVTLEFHRRLRAIFARDTVLCRDAIKSLRLRVILNVEQGDEIKPEPKKPRVYKVPKPAPRKVKPVYGPEKYTYSEPITMSQFLENKDGMYVSPLYATLVRSIVAAATAGTSALALYNDHTSKNTLNLDRVRDAWRVAMASVRSMFKRSEFGEAGFGWPDQLYRQRVDPRLIKMTIKESPALPHIAATFPTQAKLEAAIAAAKGDDGGTKDDDENYEDDFVPGDRTTKQYRLEQALNDDDLETKDEAVSKVPKKVKKFIANGIKTVTNNKSGGVTKEELEDKKEDIHKGDHYFATETEATRSLRRTAEMNEFAKRREFFWQMAPGANKVRTERNKTQMEASINELQAKMKTVLIGKALVEYEAAYPTSLQYEAGIAWAQAYMACYGPDTPFTDYLPMPKARPTNDNFDARLRSCSAYDMVDWYRVFITRMPPPTEVKGLLECSLLDPLKAPNMAPIKVLYNSVKPKKWGNPVTFENDATADFRDKILALKRSSGRVYYDTLCEIVNKSHASYTGNTKMPLVRDWYAAIQNLTVTAAVEAKKMAIDAARAVFREKAIVYGPVTTPEEGARTLVHLWSVLDGVFDKQLVDWAIKYIDTIKGALPGGSPNWISPSFEWVKPEEAAVIMIDSAAEYEKQGETFLLENAYNGMATASIHMLTYPQLMEIKVRVDATRANPLFKPVHENPENIKITERMNRIIKNAAVRLEQDFKEVIAADEEEITDVVGKTDQSLGQSSSSTVMLQAKRTATEYKEQQAHRTLLEISTTSNRYRYTKHDVDDIDKRNRDLNDCIKQIEHEIRRRAQSAATNGQVDKWACVAALLEVITTKSMTEGLHNQIVALELDGPQFKEAVSGLDTDSKDVLIELKNHADSLQRTVNVLNMSYDYDTKVCAVTNYPSRDIVRVYGTVPDITDDMPGVLPNKSVGVAIYANTVDEYASASTRVRGFSTFRTLYGPTKAEEYEDTLLLESPRGVAAQVEVILRVKIKHLRWALGSMWTYSRIPYDGVSRAHLASIVSACTYAYKNLGSQQELVHEYNAFITSARHAFLQPFVRFYRLPMSQAAAPFTKRSPKETVENLPYSLLATIKAVDKIDYQVYTLPTDFVTLVVVGDYINTIWVDDNVDTERFVNVHALFQLARDKKHVFTQPELLEMRKYKDAETITVFKEYCKESHKSIGVYDSMLQLAYKYMLRVLIPATIVILRELTSAKERKKYTRTHSVNLNTMCERLERMQQNTESLRGALVDSFQAWDNDVVPLPTDDDVLVKSVALIAHGASLVAKDPSPEGVLSRNIERPGPDDDYKEIRGLFIDTRKYLLTGQHMCQALIHELLVNAEEYRIPTAERNVLHTSDIGEVVQMIGSDGLSFKFGEDNKTQWDARMVNLKGLWRQGSQSTVRLEKIRIRREYERETARRNRGDIEVEKEEIGLLPGTFSVSWDNMNTFMAELYSCATTTQAIVERFNPVLLNYFRKMKPKVSRITIEDDDDDDSKDKPVNVNTLLPIDHDNNNGDEDIPPPLPPTVVVAAPRYYPPPPPVAGKPKDINYEPDEIAFGDLTIYDTY
jgi:hypothetical protein